MQHRDDNDIIGECPVCSSDLSGYDYAEGCCSDCLEPIESIEGIEDMEEDVAC